MSTTPSLPVRRLRTGLAVTELGFGGAQVGNLYRETTEAEAAGAVGAALAGGIRYFDTAPHYGLGLSERRLGRALGSAPRDALVVSSKVGRLLVDSPGTADRVDDDGFAVPATHQREWDFSRDGILRSVESSLRRLGTDRLDIAYLHDPDAHWVQASTTGIDALVELREQGVVGAIGAGMNQAEMLAEFVRRTDVDVVMVAGRFTLLDHGALDELLPLAAARNVGVVAAAVYNSGLLSRSVVSADARYDYGSAPEEVVARAHRIARICADHGVDLPAAALQYPLLHPSVVSVVVGMRTAGQVDGSLGRYRAEIPDELWTELDAVGLVPLPRERSTASRGGTLP
jgi:D-threo-aldose 1-dehydrogenase